MIKYKLDIQINLNKNIHKTHKPLRTPLNDFLRGFNFRQQFTLHNI
nr:hypothetical protein AUSP0115_00046 [uncultured phage]